MQPFVIGVLAVALVGAGATVVLVDRYIDQRIATTAATVDKSNAPIMVLVAKQDLPIGKAITGSDLEWQSWPKDGVQSDFLSGPKADSLKAKQVGSK